jgi:hypothetical protein
MIKNKVEIKGDIALIHIESKGKTVFAIVDREDIKILGDRYKNKLNVDSHGAVQLRTVADGKYTVQQLHHFIIGLDGSKVKVTFKNGNKLDCRKRNLSFTFTMES